MSLPTRIAAYEDCIELYARAAASKHGSRAMLGTRNAAKKYQMRMHMVRTLIRDESEQLYNPNDPRYSKCEYDNLAVSIKEDVAGNFWVYVEPYAAQVFTVEDIDPGLSPELEPDFSEEQND